MSTAIYVLSRNMKKKIRFFSENLHFLLAKFLVYLNRRVFVIFYNITLQRRFSVQRHKTTSHKSHLPCKRKRPTPEYTVYEILAIMTFSLQSLDSN